MLGAACRSIGVGATYVYDGGVPERRNAALRDAPERYAAVYREAYVKEAKRLRTKVSAVAFAISTAALAAAFFALGDLDVSTPDHDIDDIRQNGDIGRF